MLEMDDPIEENLKVFSVWRLADDLKKKNFIKALKDTTN